MSQKLTLRKVLFLLFVVSLLGVSFWGISLGQNQEKPIELDPLAANWWPKNNNIAVVDVHIKGDFPNSHVDFSLSNVTDWEGYCMNDGNQYDLDKDLKLNLIDNKKKNTPLTWSGGGQTISASWTDPAPGLFRVKVKSYDYGAYGDLTATLHKQEQDASDSQEPPSDTVSIPRDKNNNRIADGWRVENYNDGAVENYDAVVDNETGPGDNPNDGDNFSVFTEYRGFKCVTGYSDSGFTTAHKRLSPSQKEVLVFVAGSSIVSHRIGYASHLEADTDDKIVAYQVAKYGDAPHFWVNHKGTDVPGHRSQRVVRVLENNVDDNIGRLGYTFPYPNVYLPAYYPNRVDYIYVYTLEIDGSYTSQSDRDQVRKNVMGHEIGHAINLDHCSSVHSSCIMGEVAPPTTKGDHYDSDHAVNLSGYKIIPNLDQPATNTKKVSTITDPRKRVSSL